MEELKRFLEAKRKELIDFIESNQRPIALAGNVYERLLDELVSLIPLSKNGKSIALDKAHVELAIAILEATAAGYHKQRRTAYAKDYPDRFKEAIYDAFDIGQRYAVDRP